MGLNPGMELEQINKDVMREFEFRTKPFDHQLDHFNAHRDTPRRALFMEMGTGKTKCVIDNTQYLYLKGEIDTLLVLAPNGVHRNWITDELPVHMPQWLLDQSLMFFWNHGKSHSLQYKEQLKKLFTHEGLVIVTLPYTSLITKNCKKFLYDFLDKRKCFYVADEAVHFKNPNAKRTKTIHASAKYAQWRRVLTGTPLENGPFDAYSIMKFLDLGFWKQYELDNYAMFKNHFGVFKTHQYGERGVDLLVGYRRLDELGKILREHSDRVLKDDVLDLPPKLYTKRYFQITKEQRRIYDELKDEYMAWITDDDQVTAPLAITRLLRFQQVVSGYIPTPDGEEPIHDIGDVNPRLNMLEDIIEETTTQGIIYAKFTRDIDKIMRLLGPEKAVRYDGQVDDDERAENKLLFQKGKRQWFVANQAVASEGLTLVQAKKVVYYNNTYRLGQRLQSEDRAHRPGQNDPVLYEDLVAEDTVDVAIVNSLRTKRDIALLVLGDEFKSWI